MKATEYRCSCCDEVKPRADQVKWEWDHEAPETVVLVMICHDCAENIEASSVDTVEDFLEQKGE